MELVIPHRKGVGMNSSKRGRSILTPDDAKQALVRTGFCYMCGDPLPLYYLNDGVFTNRDPNVNEDHVFAESIFNTADRNFPLKLRVHTSCHADHSDNDSSIAELFKIFNRDEASATLQRLDIDWKVDGQGKAVRSYVPNLPLKDIAHRWLKGLHAALYNEHLPDPIKSTIRYPFHEISKATGEIIPPDARHYEAARLITKNRDAKNVDHVVICNGRCKYECVWKQQGADWVCLFALEIDGWSIFSIDDEERTCIGAYVQTRPDPPTGASIATSIIADPAVVTFDLFPRERERYMRIPGIPQKMKTVQSARRPKKRT
jgi:hypothetical protein